MSDELKTDLLLKDGDIVINSNNDLMIVSDRENVKQAIINRLKTNMGWYKYYPVYGSRLYTTAGEPETNTTLNLIRFYIQECLLQENRIEKIEKINITWLKNKHSVKIEIKLKLINEPEILHLVVMYNLG